MSESDPMASSAKTEFGYAPPIFKNPSAWKDEDSRRQFAITCLKWGLICRNIPHAISAIRAFVKFRMNVTGFERQLLQVITIVNLAMSESRIELDEYMLYLLEAAEFVAGNCPDYIFILEQYLPMRMYGMTAANSIAGLLRNPEYVELLKRNQNKGQILSKILAFSHLDTKTFHSFKTLLQAISETQLWHLLVNESDKGLLKVLLISSFALSLDTPAPLVDYLDPDIHCKGLSDQDLANSLSPDELSTILKFVASNTDFLATMKTYPFLELLLQCDHPFDSNAFSEIVNYEIVNLGSSYDASVLSFLALFAKTGAQITPMAPAQSQGDTLPDLPQIQDIISPSFGPFYFESPEPLRKFAELILSEIP